ncbi:hypothetical protein [Gluconobacter cerinus]|uniref:hypothetical protein n=1 Tax=Gluconobacter cerinus TaxID=38307 RepID=UPI001B8C6709|nr:hypothetical protein [Gluconobacter cerinus]MBS1044538.1 hypothetical protein [Gluconobacter cerinus]
MSEETNRLILAELRALNARLERVLPGIEGLVCPFVWQRGSQAIEQLIKAQLKPTAPLCQTGFVEVIGHENPKLLWHFVDKLVGQARSRLRRLLRYVRHIRSFRSKYLEQPASQETGLCEQPLNSSHVIENNILDSDLADIRNNGTPYTSEKGVNGDA